MEHKNLWDALEDRRSIYAIGKDSPVSDDDIRAMIEHALLFAPSAFHSQSGRVLLLFGEGHDRLWNGIKEILRTKVPADRFAPTEQKIDGFAAGHGTALFFEDQNVVAALQEKYPLYRDNFPLYSLQSSGMLQFAVWMLLESAGLGASLQHYNPLIDEFVRQTWGIDASWKLLAQMPFGNVLAPAGEKGHEPLEKRLKVSAQ